MNHTSIEKACRALGGRKVDVARVLGISPAAVTRWGDTVPVHRAIALEHASGGKVTRYDLRPDIFGERPAKPARRRRAA
jgi:DNA-binding transcriptional regulator YdaS (Cro superfamily)